MQGLDRETTTAQEIARLTRECEHLATQLIVEHTMTLQWKTRALAAEQALERLQHQVSRTTTQRRTAPDATTLMDADLFSV
jgi:hypothetical protein